MSVSKYAVAAVFLNAALASEAVAQTVECDTSWAASIATSQAFLSKPPETWNKDFIKTWGAENVSLLKSYVDGPMEDTLKQEIKNIFDGLDQYAAQGSALDIDYYINGYNAVHKPVLEEVKAELAKSPDAATVKAILIKARDKASDAVDDYIDKAKDMLRELDTSKPVCMFVAPEATPTTP